MLHVASAVDAACCMHFDMQLDDCVVSFPSPIFFLYTVYFYMTIFFGKC